LAEDGAPFQLFDRTRVGHPWERALQETERADPDRHWAVAANWRMDHRVSPDRETGDLMAFPPFTAVTDARSWLKALDLYWKDEICRPGSAASGGKTSAYVRPTNAGNRIPTRIAGFDQLVHVGSLNTIAGRIASLPGRTGVDLALQRIAQDLMLPPPHIRQGTPEFTRRISALAQGLNRTGARAVRRAVRLLADALGETEPPWWACYEHEIRDVLRSGNAENLGASLGLGHYEPGECLLIWVYRTDDAGPLFRPTVAEARQSPYHFPSPPGHEMGITMPLADGLPACREVLHRPLKGALAEARCTGEILFLSRSLAQDSPRLAALRAHHWKRMKEELYTEELEAWGNRHSRLRR